MHGQNEEQSTNGKRKADLEESHKSKKKRRLSEDHEDVSEDEKDEVDEPSSVTPKPKTHHRVALKGSSPPSPISTFTSLLSLYPSLQPSFSRLLPNLPTSYSDNPTSIQAYAVPTLLSGRDLAAISPTGTGKTVAFILPIFAMLGKPVASRGGDEIDGEGHEGDRKGPRALILAPTKELSSQIYNECLKLAQGRKWRIVLYSKATAATMKEPGVGAKVGA